MNDTLMTQEPLIRIVAFGSVLLVMAVWEVLAARRPQQIRRWQRWPSNLLIVVLDTLARKLHQTYKKRLEIGYNSSSYTRTNRLSRHDKMYHADRFLSTL